MPGVDLIADVPLRVRVEPANSMNNRFKPDPNLHFRCSWQHERVLILGTQQTGVEHSSTWRQGAHRSARAAPHRPLSLFTTALYPAGGF